MTRETRGELQAIYLHIWVRLWEDEEGRKVKERELAFAWWTEVLSNQNQVSKIEIFDKNSYLK